MTRSATTRPGAPGHESPNRAGGAPQGVEAAEGVPLLDASQIFASVGEVPYEWNIATDALHWGDNVGAVLAISDAAAIASGRAFAQLLDPTTPVALRRHRRRGRPR